MNQKQIFGIGIILLGVLILLSQMEVFYFWESIGVIWPLILIGLGAYQIFINKKIIFNNMALIVVGLLFLANNLDMLPWGFWSTFWPTILILLGLMILFNKGKKDGIKTSDNNLISINSIFSGNKEYVDSKEFLGGDISSLFGGVELDLRDSDTDIYDANIDINCIFGGVKIFVPKDWEVRTKGTPIFGEMKNQTFKQISVEDPDKPKPKLNISYFVIFGGIEIRN